MKLKNSSQIFKKLWLSVVLILTNLASAQTVSTPVVGFTTTVVKGRGSSGQSSFMSFVPVQLRKSPVFTGTGSATGTTVVLDNANLSGSLGPTSGYPTHYLLVKSGTGVGLITDIVSFTSTSVTTADDLSASIPSSTQVSIIPHTKLTDVLGTGASVILTGGSAVSGADNVMLADANGVMKTYYYKTGIGGGWKTSTGADASGLVVYPGEAILANRKQVSDTASIVQTGTVADVTSKTTFSQGYSGVASGFPVSATLTNLTPVLTGGSTLAGADNVLLINSTTGKLENFYYKTGIGAGWKTSTGGTASTSTDIGNGFLVNRKASSPSTWVQTVSW